MIASPTQGMRKWHSPKIPNLVSCILRYDCRALLDGGRPTGFSSTNMPLGTNLGFPTPSRWGQWGCTAPCACTRCQRRASRCFPTSLNPPGLLCLLILLSLIWQHRHRLVVVVLPSILSALRTIATEISLVAEQTVSSTLAAVFADLPGCCAFSSAQLTMCEACTSAESCAFSYPGLHALP
jgi:hypothetical protein